MKINFECVTEYKSNWIVEDCWVYKPDNHTIIYENADGPADYSIDLKKSCALKYLYEASKLDWIFNGDIESLTDLFGKVKLQYPWLPVFTNKVPKYIMKKFNVEE